MNAKNNWTKVKANGLDFVEAVYVGFSLPGAYKENGGADCWPRHALAKSNNT
jgi:hypothetical protein